MVLEKLPFKVELGTKTITQFITQIDSLKFQGTGKIRSASVMLDANIGAFITNPNYTGTGKTPIINQFDPMKFTITDINNVSKGMIVEVDQELGQKNVNGFLLPLEFKGREAALQRRKLTAFYQFKTPAFVIKNLIERYNNPPRPTAEPEIIWVDGGTNYIETLPNNIANIYDFTEEISYYDAIMQVINRLNQPIGSGGIGNFFSMTFEDGEFLTPARNGTILIKIFIQGTGATPTLTSTIDNPFHSLTYQIHSQAGTQTFVRGQQDGGYVPNEFHEFISKVEEITHYPSYDTTQTYIEGIITRGLDNKLYEAKIGVPITTPPPNATYWNLKTTTDLIGGINYSQWTNNKVTVTKNTCANATASYLTGGFEAPAFFDGNLIIREGFNSADGSYVFWRDFVYCKTNDSALIPNYFFTFTGTSGFYHGIRVLVDTEDGEKPVANDFIGNDRFGRPYADSLVFYDDNEWIVIRQPQIGDQAIILNEGLTFEWNVPIADQNDFANAHTHQGWPSKQRAPTGVRAWRDVSKTAGGNDVFHHPFNIEKADGLFPKDINGDDYTSYVTDSAIKITFQYDLDDQIEKFYNKFAGFFDSSFEKLVDLFDGGDNSFQTNFGPTQAQIDETKLSSYYDFGWWYVFPFPYPFTKQNGITENVGDLFGAAPGSAQKLDFACLDIQNANYSHSGKVGLNHDEVEDMGAPYTGFRFYFLFDIKLGGARKPYAGDIEFIATIYDDLSQVWRTSFNYRFLGDAEEINLSFDEFTVDRPSRTPWGIKTAFSNIVTPEIEIRSIFEQKRVRFITIQLGDSYDDKLRYLPVNLDNLVSLAYGRGLVTFEGTIDGLTLTKQPFVSSGVVLDRVINPPTIQAPNTRNLIQLRSIAIAEKDIAALQYEEFTLTTDADCQYSIEQSIMLDDQDMVKFQDSGAHTRKLVNLEEVYSWNPTGPKAGFMVTRKLIHRLPE